MRVDEDAHPSAGNGTGCGLPVEVEKHAGYYRADPERIDARLAEIEEEWSTERILSANAAALSLGGLCAGAAGKKRWFFLPAAALAFLLGRALRRTSKDSLPILTRIGYRSESDIEKERQGLRALRGDFQDATSSTYLAIASPAITTGGGASVAGLPNAVAEGIVPGEKLPRSRRTRRPRKPWYRRWLFWIPLALIVIATAVRIVMTPLATKMARDSLQSMPGFKGSFRELSIRTLTTSVIIEGLSLDRDPPADPGKPFITMEKVQLTLFWRELFKGQIVGSAKILKPKFHIVIPPSPAEAKEEGKSRPPPPPDVPDLAKTLGDVIPVRIDRVEIQDGEMVVVDAGAEGLPDIRIGNLEMTIENIETGTQLGSGRPTVFAARALVEKSGQLAMFYTADLLAKSLTFGGKAKLEGLKLAEINDFLAARSGLRVEKGTFDVYTAFTGSRGKFVGGVKPLLKGVDMEPVESDILSGLKEALIDNAISLFSDEVPGRKAVAALIPIRGEITSPSPQLLPTILSIVRNAFVEGLASGFQNLPPPASNRSILSRVTGIFSTDAGPPEAEGGEVEGGAR